MALTATPVRCDITLSLADQGLSAQALFRGAQHPSETVERVWLRVLAFCWQWCPELVCGSDLSDADGPELLAQTLDGRPLAAVFVGKPEPRRVLKAVDRAGRVRVAVLFESPLRLRQFVEACADPSLERLRTIELAAVEPAFLQRLAALELRRAEFALTIAGEHLYLEYGDQSFDAPLLRVGDAA